MEICKICNGEFIHTGALSRHLSQKHNIKYYDYLIEYLGIEHPVCSICGENKVRYHKTKFSKYCSFECSVIGNSKNGDTNKKRSESLKKFNKENPEVRENARNKLIDLYSNNDELKNHISGSLKKAWESKNKEEKKNWARGLNNDITIEKRNKTIRKLYANNDKLKQKISDSLKIVWDTKNSEEKKIWMRGILNKESQSQNEVQEYIESLGIMTIKNDRSLGFEIDILLPDYNIGIEYHGLYWHSRKSGNKSTQYHKNKMIESNKHGIRLIQIFDDEWQNKKDILKEKLRHILNKNDNKQKIYARKCEIKEIKDNETTYDFYDKNHIQGKMYGDYNIGLYYNDELISLMTFISNKLYRTDGENSFELNRFASNSNYIVIGSAGKLLNYFIKTYNPSLIYSFADLRYTDSNSNVYKSIGFQEEYISPPNYYYTKDYRNRLTKYSFSKKNLKVRFPDIYSDDKSEFEMMEELGYDRIYDCGKIKYIMEI